MRNIILAIAWIAMVSVSSPAQCPGVTTNYVSNNGQSGNMFDVVNLSASTTAVVSGLDINVDVGTWTIEVYAVTAAGPYAPVSANSAAWTLIASLPGVIGVGLNLPTPLPTTLSVPIAPGATQGFYVTVANGTTINYTNGTAVGAVAGTDGTLSILEGIGVAYPFGGAFSPRVWNGTVYYSTGGGVDWQVNTANASLDADGVTSSGCGAAVGTYCTSDPATVNIQSGLVGSGWELLVSSSPLAPASGAGIVVGGQIFNVRLDQPLFFLNGIVAPQLLPFPGSLAVPVVLNASGRISAQALWLDVSAPSGFRLSQGSQLDISVGAGPLTLPGPTADDSAVQIDFSGSPNCWCPSLPFFGTSHTSFFVISNGRVTFNAGDTTFTPSVAAALAGVPFVGLWTDLNPAGGGTITASTPGAGSGIVRVDYNTVNYFTQTVPITFGIEFNCFSGDVIIDGLQGIVANPGGGAQLLGISPGGAAADPGAQAFALGGSGGATTPNDMLYTFAATGAPALVAPLLPGTLTAINFLPDGGNNYIWLGL